MTGYFLTVVGTAALVFAASALLPESKGLERVLEFSLGLILAGCVFSPVFSVFGGIGELQGKLEATKEEVLTPDGESWLAAQREQAAAQGVTVAVCERFSLDPENVRVELSLGGDETHPTIENVKIYLQNEASYADLAGILRYLKSNYCEDCEVIPYAKK